MSVNTKYYPGKDRIHFLVSIIFVKEFYRPNCIKPCRKIFIRPSLNLILYIISFIIYRSFLLILFVLQSLF